MHDSWPVHKTAWLSKSFGKQGVLLHQELPITCPVAHQLVARATPALLSPQPLHARNPPAHVARVQRSADQGMALLPCSPTGLEVNTSNPGCRGGVAICPRRTLVLLWKGA